MGLLEARKIEWLFSFVFLITVFLGLFFINNICCGLVQAATDVPSVINVNTTWTKSNGPYELKGPVLISAGSTLTIEPGTTVNLNNFYLQINGTLIARGTISDLINLNSGIIVFKDSSIDWNEEIGSGCIIENSNLFNSRIDIANSPKISKSVIHDIYVDGSPLITENIISGQLGTSGSPIIINNSITNRTPFSVSVRGGSPLISRNSIDCRIHVTNGFPTISNNFIGDGIHVDSHGGSVEITDNVVNIRGDYFSIFVTGSSAKISDNNITGNGNLGICLSGPYTFSINNNKISNCATAITASNPCPLTVEWNYIVKNIDGISLTISDSVFAPFEQKWKSPLDFPFVAQNNIISNNSGFGINLNHPSATIINNSISGNSIGITIRDLSGYTPLPEIHNNNIFENEYNLKSEVSNNINVINNWWGTTDISTINQTLYDLKYDFNLGTINFIPILTQENPEIPEFPSWIFLPLILTSMLYVIIFRKRIIKSGQTTKIMFD